MRALIPSKKSNTAPMMMNKKAMLIWPPRAKTVATQPEIRLQQVRVLGMCFFIIFIKLTSYKLTSRQGDMSL